MILAAGVPEGSAAHVLKSAFTLPSFAKINWSLRVFGKRPDGYHEVRTVLQTVSLHDDIRFEQGVDEEIVLSCDHSAVPTDETNLIFRAAQALTAHFRITRGANISLRKRIPVQAGLGGGSSNAATTLLGLADLWGLQAGRSELMKLGASLGSDVPFFFYGGRALATGKGTEITPLSEGPPRSLLIVTPNKMVSTSAAYRAFAASSLTSKSEASILSSSHGYAVFSDSDQQLLDKELENDFERVIFDMEPEIERARTALVRVGARGVLLCGSGSSVFGIFDSEESQQRALEEIQVETGWRTSPCVTLSREEYLRALSSCGTAALTLS